MKITDMRSLPPEAKFDKRLKVIDLRDAGRSYSQIAMQLGLSRTGVFDICKRHRTVGAAALHDAPSGRARGDGRTLAPEQESMVRQQILDSTPDELAMPEALWTHGAVSRLIGQRLGIVLPVRTLSLYLARWGFSARRPTRRQAGLRSARMDHWWTDEYPAVAARSKAEGCEINWGSENELLDEKARARAKAAARGNEPERPHDSDTGHSVISSITNKDRQRWNTFDGPLDAGMLIDFLRRLIRGTDQKKFLIMDDLRVQDEGSVTLWLAEHEDAIEGFHLPTLDPER